MTHTILLADDSPTIRKVVELTLSETDVRVESVGSGVDALERLDAIRPDLILADVEMPEPSGYEICRRVKDSDRPVPVLLLSGTFESFDQRRARDCGADGHLIKPFESQTLLEQIETFLSVPTRRGERAAPADAPDSSESPTLEGPSSRAEERAASSEAPAGDAAAPSETPAPLPPESIDAVARAVVERLSADVVREIAGEVVPRLAEEMIRRRIRELEQEDS